MASIAVDQFGPRGGRSSRIMLSLAAVLLLAACYARNRVAEQSLVGGAQWGAHHLNIQTHTWHWMGHHGGPGPVDPINSCDTDGGFFYVDGPPNPPGAAIVSDGNCPVSGEQCYTIMIPQGGVVVPEPP
jgi:hypothetical protein